MNTPLQSTVETDIDHGLVSIVMPNYNGAEYVKETIESVLAQTYSNWELLFVDDCSSDNSLEIVDSFNDPRIKIFRNEKNKGAAASRNLALNQASGRWVAFLDSDDLWKPWKLEKQLTFMIQNDCHFTYTSYEHIDEDSNKLNVRVSGPRMISKRKMFRYDYIGCLTVMYDANVINKIQIDESLKSRNDYAIWLKACKFADCYYIDQVMAQYRIRKNSLSHSGFKKLLYSQYRLFRYGEKMSVVCAVYYTCLNCFFGFWKKVFYVRKES